MHAAPHLSHVFTDNIILYFNYLVLVLHVFKRSRSAHITFFESLHDVCLSNLRILFGKKTLETLFPEKKPFYIWNDYTNTRLFTTVKSVAMLKIIEFY